MRFSTVDDAVREVRERRLFPTEFRPEKDLLGYIWQAVGLLAGAAIVAIWIWVVSVVFPWIDRDPDGTGADKFLMVSVAIVPTIFLLYPILKGLDGFWWQWAQVRRFRAAILTITYPLESHLDLVRELRESSDLDGYDLHLALGHPTVVFSEARTTRVGEVVQLKPVGHMDFFVDLTLQRAGLGATLRAVAANAAAD